MITLAWNVCDRHGRAQWYVHHIAILPSGRREAYLDGSWYGHYHNRRWYLSTIAAAAGRGMYQCER